MPPSQTCSVAFYLISRKVEVLNPGLTWSEWSGPHTLSDFLLYPYYYSFCSWFSSHTGLHDRHTNPRTLVLAVSSNWNIIFSNICMGHSNAFFRSFFFFFKYNLSKNPSLKTLDKIISSLALQPWLLTLYLLYIYFDFLFFIAFIIIWHHLYLLILEC